MSLARWNGSASDDDARMLMAAGVAAYFVAILACRGPYADLVKLRRMARPGRVIEWHPKCDAIVERLPNRPGDTFHPKPSICAQLCAYLESQWAWVFESETSFAAVPLATRLLESGLCPFTEPHVVSWCRVPSVGDMETVPDFDCEVMVDTKCMPVGLPADDVELCLELLTAGRRLLETQPNGTHHQTSVPFEPTRQYAALVPFHRNGLEPRNVQEAFTMLQTSTVRCGAMVVPAYADGSIGVDMNDPSAFLTPTTGNFWFDSFTTVNYAADFRFPAQRVRQFEFVQHYMRLVVEAASLSLPSALDSGIGVDDVTVMLNMAAHLDRMWRRDFEFYKIVGNIEKERLRGSQFDLVRGQRGDDAARAMGDIKAIQRLGKLDASKPEEAMIALNILRTTGSSRGASYMNVAYAWPESMTPELIQLRHELSLFRYNRATLPYAMELLVLDIIVVEACCVRVLDTLGKSSMPIADGQQAWVAVCFAMFTIFDLRPIFMSSMPLMMQDQKQQPQLQRTMSTRP